MTWTTENCVPTDEQLTAAFNTMSKAEGFSPSEKGICMIAHHLQMRGECEPPTDAEVRRAEFVRWSAPKYGFTTPTHSALADFCRHRADERDALRKENERLQAELAKMKKEHDNATLAHLNDALEDAKKQDDEFTPAQLQKIREVVEDIVGIESGSRGKGSRKKTPEERYVVESGGGMYWKVVDTLTGLLVYDFNIKETAEIFRLGLIAKAKKEREASK